MRPSNPTISRQIPPYPANEDFKIRHYQDLVHFLCARRRCAPENGEPGARPGSLNVCYWLKHSRLDVTHLLSTGASKSRVVVRDFEFSTVLGA